MGEEAMGEDVLGEEWGDSTASRNPIEARRSTPLLAAAAAAMDRLLLRSEDCDAVAGGAGRTLQLRWAANASTEDPSTISSGCSGGAAEGSPASSSWCHLIDSLQPGLPLVILAACGLAPVLTAGWPLLTSDPLLPPSRGRAMPAPSPPGPAAVAIDGRPSLPLPPPALSPPGLCGLAISPGGAEVTPSKKPRPPSLDAFTCSPG